VPAPVGQISGLRELSCVAAFCLTAPVGGEVVVGGTEMSFISGAAVVLAMQIVTPSTPAPGASPPLIKVQMCPDGYDADLRGRCYPTGTVPPQYQAARRGYQGGYGGGGYGACPDGRDLDVRDGRCHRTGTVPYRFQQSRQQPYYDGD
jgi:hypothetical protein